MTYVAISSGLINTITHHIEAMIKSELGSLADPDELLRDYLTSPEGKAYIDEWMWKGEEGARVFMEKYAIKRAGTVRVRFSTEVRPEEGPRTVEDSLTVDMQCAPHRLVPLSSPSSYYMNNLVVELNLMGEDSPKFEEYKRALTAQLECRERWTKVKEQIINFIRKAKSLNEALKLWPDVARYVPVEYVDKANEKKERPEKKKSEAAEALKDLDVDLAATSAVLARMAGGPK